MADHNSSLPNKPTPDVESITKDLAVLCSIHDALDDGIKTQENDLKNMSILQSVARGFDPPIAPGIANFKAAWEAMFRELREAVEKFVTDPNVSQSQIDSLNEQLLSVAEGIRLDAQPCRTKPSKASPMEDQKEEDKGDLK
ncbi:hypothetical protein VSDG_05983 [Cytospora chrysosperma]|uniref:Uncharacterized protein n=1 Tax=Cytospora chrysosperma TaxID=252740 RepID=A0A423VTP5_CYTCH|nr:hypothetical protein VSDG_05983 [Valsa sordida]